MEQQKQEIVEEITEVPQKEEPLEGDFLWASNQKERIFIDLETQSAYSQMLELINWVKPKEFSVISGNTQEGKTAVKINYIK